MVPRNVAAMIHRHDTQRIQPVWMNETTYRRVIQAFSVSGVEESTTLEDEPPQDKACCLGRFLGSLPFARNDMSEVVPFSPHRLYSLRSVAMGHRRYIVPCIGWYRSPAQVICETWRAAGCRPYDFAGGWIFYPTYFKNGHVRHPITVSCQLKTIVN